MKFKLSRIVHCNKNPTYRHLSIQYPHFISNLLWKLKIKMPSIRDIKITIILHKCLFTSLNYQEILTNIILDINFKSLKYIIIINIRLRILKNG